MRGFALYIIINVNTQLTDAMVVLPDVVLTRLFNIVEKRKG